MDLLVECHAGHRGEQEPRVLILGDRRIRVQRLLDAWLDPEHRYFKVQGEDGCSYLVRHDHETGAWELVLMAEGPIRGFPTQTRPT